MSFIENPRFPEGVSQGAKGGPAFLTDVVTVESGFESRSANWSQQRARYEVGHNARTQALFMTIDAFFRIALGRANGFRFKDWKDFTVVSGQGVFVMLTSTTFQMYKRYTSGASHHDRIIQKPVVGTGAVTGGSGVLIDYTTGIVTVSSGTPTAWTGQFDVPCRFDIDHMGDAEIIGGVTGSYILGWQSIPILEIRV